MTKQKLLGLSNEIYAFMQEKLKNESVCDVLAATIFALSYYVSSVNGDIVLPETICMKGLIILDNVIKENVK